MLDPLGWANLNGGVKIMMIALSSCLQCQLISPTSNPYENGVDLNVLIPVVFFVEN